MRDNQPPANGSFRVCVLVMILRRQWVPRSGDNLTAAPFAAIDAGMRRSTGGRVNCVEPRVAHMLKVFCVFVGSHLGSPDA